MQKYKYDGGFSQDGGMKPYADDGTEFYLASEADARIAELESSLQDALFALKKQREAAVQWTNTVDLAIEQGEKTLALRSTG